MNYICVEGIENKMIEERKYKSYFEKEYATSWRAEVRWLAGHGVEPVYVKHIEGIDIYKYIKSTALFSALTDFYKSRTDA